MNELKIAVSFIIYNEKGEFLAIKRPPEDEELGPLWGLPATNVQLKKESLDEAVLRDAMEKLNCKVTISERLPLAMIQKRQGYDLLLLDYKCDLVPGQVPDVKKAKTKGTKYTAQQWTKNTEMLFEIAKKGSICTQLFLNYLGKWPLESFVTELK